uniref:Uncharacterized protein n=1 Tax=Escherichia coli TaxID=562 RepID=A0A5B9SY67_ECOLX|nr:hypothetical protein [Escherichia coli]
MQILFSSASFTSSGNESGTEPEFSFRSFHSHAFVTWLQLVFASGGLPSLQLKPS